MNEFQENKYSEAGQDLLYWHAFTNGDRDALGMLFRMYYPHLYKYGNKIVAENQVLEDCIQELFIELWQHKNPPPTLSVKAYLLKALKYKLLKTLHKKNLLLPDAAAFEISYESFIISKQEDEEKIRKVVQAIDQLSNRQKEIIYLKFYQNLSYEEVSEIMNINYQVARNLLHQAIKAMRKILSGTAVLVPLLVM
jgi:RNA polymerase sigma-70 factor (ECF subfamily)